MGGAPAIVTTSETIQTRGAYRKVEQGSQWDRSFPDIVDGYLSTSSRGKSVHDSAYIYEKEELFFLRSVKGRRKGLIRLYRSPVAATHYATVQMGAELVGCGIQLYRTWTDGFPRQ